MQRALVRALAAAASASTQAAHQVILPVPGSSSSCWASGKPLFQQQQQRCITRLRAAVTNARDYFLDSVAQADDRLETVKLLVRLVGRQQCHIWNVSRHSQRKRLLSVAYKYPSIFTVVYDEFREPWIDFTPEMEKLYNDEQEMITARDELLSVNILRKMLMMSKDHELSLTKLSWVKRDYWFPDDFDKNLVHKYGNFFEIHGSPRGPVLKLAAWDQTLAVTAREKTLLWCPDIPRSGFYLTGCEQISRDYEMFQRLIGASPYEPVRPMNPKFMLAEKRTVAIYHELLSFVPEKRCVIPTLCMFNSEFSLPKESFYYLKRHPGIFYVSHAVDPPMVFLKEAFSYNKLKVKGPEDSIRDRYLSITACSK